MPKTKKETEKVIAPTVMSPDELCIEQLRVLIRSFYDIQKIRIMTGNRVVQSFKLQLGVRPSTKEESLKDDNKEADKIIQQIKKEYKLISEGMISNKKSLKATIKELSSEMKWIHNDKDHKLVEVYMDLKTKEDQIKFLISKEVENHGMWSYFFNTERCVGCGVLMSAVCLSYFDINKAKYEGSFIRYAGLDPVVVKGKKVIGYEEDTHKPIYSEEEGYYTVGRNRSILVESEYTDKNGETKVKKGLGYQADLHTMLLGRLGESFLKKPGCHYEQIYRGYRNRLNNHPTKKNMSDAQKHRISNRYMIVCFVKDLFAAWKKYQKEELPTPYEVGVLGKDPHPDKLSTIIADGE
jgi:mRNA-degrading endonuclease YafQ of YafQ-DinJ toxin-antitoxin module